jgi:6-phosphogluconolactonase
MIGDMTAGPEVRIVDTGEALAEAAAREVLAAAEDAVATHDRFTIALAGGATPRASYERLALPPLRDRMPWSRTWVFFGDERGVGPDHRDSNYRMAHEALLSRVPVPPAQVFRIRGEADDPEEAAAGYARTIAQVFEGPRGALPRFDLVLLGLGIDGHTASLFPGSPVLKEVFRVVAAVHASAATIPQRFTLTLPVLNEAARVIFLVSGAEKAKVVKAALGPHGAALPAGMIRPAGGRLLWLVDRAAAALLPVAKAG